MRSFLPSVALVSAAFLFGCQDMGSGPVGPDGPQFNKPFKLDKDACTALGKVLDEATGHCHDDEEPTAATFSITIVSGQIPATTAQFFESLGSGIFVDPFVLDLSFFDGLLGCDMGIKTGQFRMIKGDADGPHVHIGFEFTHNGSAHSLSIPGVPVPFLNNTWDPTTVRIAEESPDGFGFWKITAKGKNHKNGCKGEDNGASDGGTGDDLIYGITVTPSHLPTITPAAASVATGGTVDFDAIGGAGGNVFSIETNTSGGSIDSSTGAYTAGGTAGMDVVRLTDTDGNFAEATVTVT